MTSRLQSRGARESIAAAVLSLVFRAVAIVHAKIATNLDVIAWPGLSICECVADSDVRRVFLLYAFRSVLQWRSWYGKQCCFSFAFLYLHRMYLQSYLLPCVVVLFFGYGRSDNLPVPPGGSMHKVLSACEFAHSSIG
jgi:hypothetical protein